MKRKPLDRMDCSIAKALDIVGDPWTMLILRDALLGVKRFETFSTAPRHPAAPRCRPGSTTCANGGCSNSARTRTGPTVWSTC